MFNGGMATTSTEIELPDVEPAAFLALLKFLYSDEVQIGPETVMTTLYTAKKYAVPALEAHCVEFLKKNLRADNAFMLLTQARLFDEPQLASLCLENIDKNTADAITAEGFTDIDLGEGLPCACACEGQWCRHGATLLPRWEVCWASDRDGPAPLELRQRQMEPLPGLAPLPLCVGRSVPVPGHLPSQPLREMQGRRKKFETLLRRTDRAEMAAAPRVLFFWDCFLCGDYCGEDPMVASWLWHLPGLSGALPAPVRPLPAGPAQSGILMDREVVSLFLHFTVNPKPRVDFIDRPRCCLRGKECSINRFQQVESRWGYSGTSDRVRFSVNKRIFVVGFGLYGSIHGPTDYQVNIQIIHTDSNTVLGQNDTGFSCDGSASTFRVMFKEPVEVLPSVNYTACATLKGPDSHYGTKGLRKVTHESPTTGAKTCFTFCYAAGNNNGTSVEDGQIPEVIFYT
nr:BTB/POZ domain-containing protein 2 [Loxodonta africana]